MDVISVIRVLRIRLVCYGQGNIWIAMKIVGGMEVV